MMITNAHGSSSSTAAASNQSSSVMRIPSSNTTAHDQQEGGKYHPRAGEALSQRAEAVMRNAGLVSQMVSRLAGMMMTVPSSVASSPPPQRHRHQGKGGSSSTLLDSSIIHRLGKDYTTKDVGLENLLSSLQASCDQLLVEAIPLSVEGAHAGQMWAISAKRAGENTRLLSQATSSVEWLTESNRELRAQLSALDKQVSDQQKAFTQWAVRGAAKASVDSISGAMWYRSDLQDLCIQNKSERKKDDTSIATNSVAWKDVLDQMERASSVLRADRDDLAAKLEKYQAKATPEDPPARIELDKRTAELEGANLHITKLEKHFDELRVRSSERQMQLEAQVASRDEEITTLKERLSGSSSGGTSPLNEAHHHHHHSRDRTLVASLHLFAQHSLASKYLCMWRVYSARRRVRKDAVMMSHHQRSSSNTRLQSSSIVLDGTSGRGGRTASVDSTSAAAPSPPPPPGVISDNTWEVAELLVRLGKQHYMLLALEDERDALATENVELRAETQNMTASQSRSRGGTSQGGRPPTQMRQSTPATAPSSSYKYRPKMAMSSVPRSMFGRHIMTPLDSSQQELEHTDDAQVLSTLSADSLRCLITDHPELFIDEHSVLQQRRVATLDEAEGGGVGGKKRPPPGSGGPQQVTISLAKASMGGANTVSCAAASVGSVIPTEGWGTRGWVESLVRPRTTGTSSSDGRTRVRPLDVLAALQQEVDRRYALKKAEEARSSIRRSALPDAVAKRKAMLHHQLVLASEASLDNSGALLASPIRSSTGHRITDDDVAALTMTPTPSPADAMATTPPLDGSYTQPPAQEVTLEAVQVRSLKLYSVLQPLLGVIQRRLHITNCPLPPLPLYEATTTPIVTVVLQWSHTCLARLLQLLSYDDRLTHCKFRLYFLSAQLRRRIKESEADLVNIRMDHRARNALSLQIGEFRRIVRAVAAERARIDSLRAEWKVADAGATKERQEASRVQCQRIMEAVENAAADYARQMEANVITAYLLQAETSSVHSNVTNEQTNRALVDAESARRIQVRELRLLSGLRESKKKTPSSQPQHRAKGSIADPDVESATARNTSGIFSAQQSSLLPPLQPSSSTPPYPLGVGRGVDGSSGTLFPSPSSSPLSLLNDLHSLRAQMEAAGGGGGGGGGSRIPSISSREVINYHTLAAKGNKRLMLAPATAHLNSSSTKKK